MSDLKLMRILLYKWVKTQISACVFHSGEDDLDILTALLAESEGIGEEQESQEQADDLDVLFDEENDEEYKEGVEEEERNVDEMLELFGDVDDIKQEEEDKESEGDRENLNKSKEDLQGLLMYSGV